MSDEGIIAIILLVLLIMGILVLAILVLSLLAHMFIAKKLGLEMWEGLLPYYREYKFATRIFGEEEGFKGLLIMIPVFGLIFSLKYYKRLCYVMNKPRWHGWLLLLLPFPFLLILAFGKSQFNYELM